MTTNDQEATELLVKINMLQPIVSHYMRQGMLNMALTECSKLEDATRKLNWRLLALLERKP